MSRRFNSALLVLALAVLGGGFQWYSAIAEEDAEQLLPSDSEIAILDVSRVFQNDKRFQEQLEKMRVQVKDYEVEMKVTQSVINDLTEQLKPLKPGTEAHSTIQRQIAQSAAALQVDVQLKKNEFEAKEAELYAKTYAELQTTVARHARARKIRLVIRSHDASFNISDRKGVLALVNGNIVFHDQIDITDDIIRALNDRREPELN